MPDRRWAQPPTEPDHNHTANDPADGADYPEQVETFMRLHGIPDDPAGRVLALAAIRDGEAQARRAAADHRDGGRA